MFPDRAGWDLKALLLGRAVDALNLLVWSKTKSARRGQGRPRSVIPVFSKRKDSRAGAKPKAAPLSKIKERMAKLHAPRGPRHLTAGPPKSREERIREMFRGD